jgi:hypothetical protein
MRQSPRAAELTTHGGFTLHAAVGRIVGVGLGAQSVIVAGLVAFVLVLASYLDGSLVLPGRDVGLLEHPAIWAFIGLQIALPLVLERSIKTLLRAHTALRSSSHGPSESSDALIGALLRFVRLKEKSAVAVATVLYCAGLAAFVWNTYQNQHPRVVVPFDFWDSSTFQRGFWVTRIYKLYLFAWLLPYIALVHTAILVVALRSLHKARVSGLLKLAPFHPDGAGGLGFVPELVATPVIVTLLIASIPIAGVFMVHRGPDVTPLIGVAIVVAATAMAYGLPTLVLRREIIAMKTDLVAKLRSYQEAYYTRIIEGAESGSLWPEANESFDYFEKVCGKVQAISNFPHLRRLLSYAGVAFAPSIISVVLDLVGKLSPVIAPHLRMP